MPDDSPLIIGRGLHSLGAVWQAPSANGVLGPFTAICAIKCIGYVERKSHNNTQSRYSRDNSSKVFSASDLRRREPGFVWFGHDASFPIDVVSLTSAPKSSEVLADVKANRRSADLREARLRQKQASHIKNYEIV